MKYLKKRYEENEELVSLFEEKLGLRREVSRVLAMRGFADLQAADNFLHPFVSSFTPWQNYDGIAEAIVKISEVIANNGRIVVYGDYDCDGVCSTSMLYLELKELGADVTYYVPHRIKDGYGLNIESLEEIVEACLPELIITVDCGVTAVDEIAYAQDILGVEVIVTDHHEPQEELPNCIIVNPKVARKENCFNELCGAGVVFKLIEALSGQNQAMKYIDLAALATIADIVPLVEDNRIIVHYGVEIINSRAREAVKLLLDISFDDPLFVVTASDIAYKLVPKINAIGRLSEPSKAVSMFVEGDYFYAKSMVQHAMETNDKRRAKTTEMYNDCLAKIKDYNLQDNLAIVLHDDKWEIGIVGIVSAKIVEKFKRPTILFASADGMYKGSARSIEGVNLYNCVASVSSYLEHFGGHSMACGMAIKPENFSSFVAALNSRMRAEDYKLFLPSSYYDLELPIEEVNNKLVDDMSILEPFGAGNPTVKYLCKAEGSGFIRVGATQHIKNRIHDELELIIFDGLPKQGQYNRGVENYIILEGNTSIYKNKKYVTGTVLDILSGDEQLLPSPNYTAIKHMYQMKYAEDEASFDIKPITDSEIDGLFARGNYGTCYIAYNNDTYRAFHNKYRDKLVRAEITYISEENPFNRLILDIDSKQNLEYYSNIVFLDRPARLSAIDYIKLNKDCNIYLSEAAEIGYNANISIVKKHFMPIESMRGIFLDLNKLLSQNKVERLGELYDLFSEGGEDVNVEFYLAVYVFFELGILKVIGGKIAVDTAVKTSLDNSSIYKGIEALVLGK